MTIARQTYRSWSQVLDLLMMEVLRMTTTHFEQPGDGGLGGFRQSRSGAETASFVEMVNCVFSLGFTHFGIKQGDVGGLTSVCRRSENSS
jgi:hypothetical protein